MQTHRLGLAVLLALLTVGCGMGAVGCNSGVGVEREPTELAGSDPARGVAAIEKYSCGACHVIPGAKDATATIGPSLEGIAARTQLAGQLPNTPANMLKWIQRPQEINAETSMPEMGVTDQDARDIAAHLYTLK